MANPSETDPLTRWVQRMRAEGLSKRTVTDWPAIVRRAARFAGADPSAFTTDKVVDYLADLPSAGTRQTYFTALRAWHYWLIDEGVRDDDPMARLRRPRAPRGEPHPVATGHLEVLLGSNVRRRTRTAVLLAACQGLRVHEVVKVRGEDVDLIGGRLRTVGKGGVDRWKPLHPLVAAEARDYPRRGYWFPSHVHHGRPIRSDSLSAVISRAMKRVDVPGTAHSLRHWYGTELVRGGANLRTVQKLMRHASVATTQIYTLVDDDQQRAAVLRLPVPRTERDAS
jgi:site-specific recombinase XerD